jgi:LPXTG-motif cell wall-anchored protein
LAKQNIKFLLDEYDTVVAVCTMKAAYSTASDIIYEKFLFESSDSDEKIDSELDLYLDTIYFHKDMHLSAVWQLKYLTECLDTFDPDAIFFSFDGSRGYDQPDETMTEKFFGMSMAEFEQADLPDMILENYDKALAKLAECMENEELYIMIADGENSYSVGADDYDLLSTANQPLRNMAYMAMSMVDPITMSTPEGRAKIRAAIENSGDAYCEYDGNYYRGINIRDYAAVELGKYSVKYYSYSEPMSSTVKIKEDEKYKMVDNIDPRFNVGSPIVVTLPIPNDDGTLTTSSLDKLEVKKSDLYTQLIMQFTDEKNVPIMITIPLTLKTPASGFADSNEDFDHTNIGNATVATLDEYSDNTEVEEAVRIQTETPKLYLLMKPSLPTTGGRGIGLYLGGGAAIMMLAAVMRRRKKRLEYEE